MSEDNPIGGHNPEMDFEREDLAPRPILVFLIALGSPRATTISFEGEKPPKNSKSPRLDMPRDPMPEGWVDSTGSRRISLI